jgi:LCP family protein required for cell wall assembly
MVRLSFSKREWGRHGMPALSLLLLLLLVASSLAGCGAPADVSSLSPTPGSVSDAAPTAVPSWTALPTVPAAVPVTPAGKPASPEPTVSPTSVPPTVTWTPTRTPTPTATSTSTSTPAHTATATAPATTALTSTPLPTAGPTITPTETITPTPTPTLTPTPMFTPTPLPTVATADDVVHILLVGLDSTQDMGSQRTDVILVAVVNKDTKQVSLLSIPRDLWVYIPTYGWSRINVAHPKGYTTGYPGGGPGLLMDTIEMNLGIPIDHWVRVDFQGFKRVVDELGGVEMSVACPVNLTYQTPGAGGQEQILKPGVYHMDGETALRYVRTRREGTDFDRARRQHQFLKAMWVQAKSPDLLLKIPGLWSALRDSFETDLNLGDALSLAPLALDLKPERIRSRYIGPNQTIDWRTHDGWRVLLPRYDKIQQLVAGLYAPPSATGDQVANEGARVLVQNGTLRPQLARIAADLLRWEGVNVVETAPADTPDYERSRIIVYSEKPKTLEVLVQHLGTGAEDIVYQLDPNQDADMLVILGADYDPCH